MQLSRNKIHTNPTTKKGTLKKRLLFVFWEYRVEGGVSICICSNYPFTNPATSDLLIKMFEMWKYTNLQTDPMVEKVFLFCLFCYLILWSFINVKWFLLTDFNNRVTFWKCFFIRHRSLIYIQICIFVPYKLPPTIQIIAIFSRYFCLLNVRQEENSKRRFHHQIRARQKEKGRYRLAVDALLQTPLLPRWEFTLPSVKTNPAKYGS